jgi:hypothetical protein
VEAVALLVGSSLAAWAAGPPARCRGQEVVADDATEEAVLAVRAVGLPPPSQQDRQRMADRVRRLAATQEVRLHRSFEEWARRRRAGSGDGPGAPLPRWLVGGLRRRVVDAVSAARRARAALDEGRAIRSLVAARRFLDAHPSLPGASVWAAEVETELGLTALQAGRQRLGERALERAASLDPDRGVRAGEAPPTVVAAARRRAEELAEAPLAEVTVRTPGVGGAVLELDGRRIGPTPVTTRVPEGHHHLRLVAPDHRPWGVFIDLPSGSRPPLEVQLDPPPLMRWARKADLFLEAMPPTGGRWQPAITPPRPPAGHTPGPEAWVLVVGPRGRALLQRCRGGRCGAPERIEADRPLSLPPAPPAREARPDATPAYDDAALAWLLSAPPGAADVPGAAEDRRPGWVRGLAIGAAVLGLALGTTAAVLWSRDRDEPRAPRFQVDPTDLLPPPR